VGAVEAAYSKVDHAWCDAVAVVGWRRQPVTPGR